SSLSLSLSVLFPSSPRYLPFAFRLSVCVVCFLFSPATSLSPSFVRVYRHLGRAGRKK
ncbi:hypothetical protein CSUI_004920, partial [Cystoisospora suis]